MIEQAAELGPLIGRGRTAQVYAWGSDRVLKLYHAGLPRRLAEEEAAAARIVSAADVGTPRFDGLRELDGRTGLLFERVEGPPMARLMVARPWLVLRCARQLAERHAAIHELPATGLRSQRAGMEQAIREAPRLDEAVRARVLATIAALPDGDRLCHGDFHPDNVLCTPRGAMVIDWQPASRGNPAADVARTLYLCAEAAVPADLFNPASRLVIAGWRRAFAAMYWRRYRSLTGMTAAEIAGWRIPVLAARLHEGIEEEQERLVTLVARG
jgi:Ser/Thr protein kinase RdoA (MazF antagonist)